MRYTRAMAVTMGAIMLIMPGAYVVSAEGTGHEEGAPMMVTMPAENEPPISCAVYFADNMVFAPQWRVDNLVRIEMMIIDMTSFECPRKIENSTINLPISFFEEEFPEYLSIDEETGDTVTLQQEFLMADSENIAYTSMVSVSYICVTIIGVGGDAIGYSQKFEAGWLAADPYTQVIKSDLGREVNQHGNLIYGMLWDTADPVAQTGEYRVDVQLGKVVEVSPNSYVGEIGGDDPWYTVDYTVGHLYVGDGALLDDDYPYVCLVSNEDPIDDSNPDGDSTVTVDGVDLYLYGDLGIGLGGAGDDTAWVLLGPLIGRGPGGGSGDGGGNGGDNGGNGHGNLGNRLRSRA